MISTTFTEFRIKMASFLDKVENGEAVIITRYGRPIAEIVPPSTHLVAQSWKRPPLRLKLKGVFISRLVMDGRKKSRS